MTVFQRKPDLQSEAGRQLRDKVNILARSVETPLRDVRRTAPAARVTLIIVCVENPVAADACTRGTGARRFPVLEETDSFPWILTMLRAQLRERISGPVKLSNRSSGRVQSEVSAWAEARVKASRAGKAKPLDWQRGKLPYYRAKFATAGNFHALARAANVPFLQ
jgi:hypothetical protein